MSWYSDSDDEWDPAQFVTEDDCGVCGKSCYVADMFTCNGGDINNDDKWEIYLCDLCYEDSEGKVRDVSNMQP
eukprot:3123738-Pyramimonas_sp.AAC.1